MVPGQRQDPLAIELATARRRLLSPRALRERLDHRLALLGGSPRDLPRRQQTLRATIDWSYLLLNAESRALFAWLAVFAGGFTLDAAEAICAAECAGCGSVLEGLEALLDASLLTREVGIDGEPRDSMLETIRENAMDRLSERDAVEDVARVRRLLSLLRRACRGGRPRPARRPVAPAPGQ